MKRYVLELYIEADSIGTVGSLLDWAMNEILSSGNGAACELNGDWDDGYMRGELVDTENEVNRGDA